MAVTHDAPPAPDADATLREQATQDEHGTLAGVVTPTLPTILGVIMFAAEVRSWETPGRSAIPEELVCNQHDHDRPGVR